MHPDRTGRESAPFIELLEAYTVLSDPRTRLEHDRELATRNRQLTARRRAAEPLVTRGPVEPLRAVEPAGALREIHLDPDSAHYQPSFEELWERWWSNFTGADRPKAERLESLTVEIVLTPEQAVRGGRVPVWLPGRQECATCRGRGAVGAYICWRCEGRGSLTMEQPVEIAYPPGTREGDVSRVALDRLGMGNFFLTLWFRVKGGAL